MTSSEYQGQRSYWGNAVVTRVLNFISAERVLVAAVILIGAVTASGAVRAADPTSPSQGDLEAGYRRCGLDAQYPGRPDLVGWYSQLKAVGLLVGSPGLAYDVSAACHDNGRSCSPLSQAYFENYPEPLRPT